MVRIPNPYIVGTPIPSPALFYGRAPILSFVRDTLNPPQQRVVVLYGMRRIGKTSVLYELQRRLSDEFHSVYFDLMGQAGRPLPHALYEIANHIADSLDEDPPARFTDLFQFRDYLETACNKSPDGKPILLLLDEFDDLSDQEINKDAAAFTLFDYLRDLLNVDLPVAFVFVVGRRLTELPQNFQSILKQAPYRKISYLSEKDTHILITKPVAEYLTFTDTAVDTITNLTSGHPYFTQLICFELFRRGMNREDKTIRPRDVTAVLDEAIETGKGGLAWLWDALPLAERFVMSAIAEISGPSATASTEDVRNLLARYDLKFLGLEITEAPNLLVQWEILRDTGSGYRFSVDLVRRWIAQEHPLAQARREVEIIVPRANRYFENAREAHQAGELTLAIEDYQRTLVANPNHVRAQLGLAQALEEQGEVQAAHQAFRKAYELDQANSAESLAHSFDELAAKDVQHGRLEEAAKKLERAQTVSATDTRIMRLSELQDSITRDQKKRQHRFRQMRLAAIILVALAIIVVSAVVILPLLQNTLSPAEPIASENTLLILIANFEGEPDLDIQPEDMIQSVWAEQYPNIEFEQVSKPFQDQNEALEKLQVSGAVGLLTGWYAHDSLGMTLLFPKTDDESILDYSFDKQEFYGLRTQTLTDEVLNAFAEDTAQEFDLNGLDDLSYALVDEEAGKILFGYGRLVLIEYNDLEWASFFLNQAYAAGVYGAVILSDSEDNALAFVPEGEFVMGRAADEAHTLCQAYSNDCERDFAVSAPLHNVLLSSYFIDQAEVSNQAYNTCVEANTCQPPSQLNSRTRGSYYDNPEFVDYPVLYVSWDQAQKYCEWRGGSLPTEAQWEKAARWDPHTGSSLTYPWGEETPRPDLANFGLEPGDTERIWDYGASPMGALNMVGNAAEWVYDAWDPYFYEMVGDSANPVAPEQGIDERTFRGGSYGNVFDSGIVSIVDPAYRSGHNPGPNEAIGFRCAFDSLGGMK
ncbi:MAG: SUMF1/EgtB/PvdO family nonheme iron enzyme [Chloroflexi bacterium]|nr:SUMF1/EgtB/PvdO family nonheme iron enzyme [Chloroflexota bacterium]